MHRVMLAAIVLFRYFNFAGEIYIPSPLFKWPFKNYIIKLSVDESDFLRLSAVKQSVHSRYGLLRLIVEPANRRQICGL